MTTDAYIVDCGARTPLGRQAWTTAAAVRAGISRLGFHPYLLDQYGDPMRVAIDGGVDGALAGEQRMLVLAESALGEVCVGIQPFLPRTAVFLGLPEPRPGWSPLAATSWIRAMVGRVVPTVALDRVLPLPFGHAAALMGMVRAVEALRAGDCELAIVGGVDSYVHVDTLEWLDEQGQLHNDQDSRSSFVPGEGAGFCVLASQRWCQAQGITPLARIVGLGLANEPNRIKTETVCLGDGLSQAVRDATRGLSLPAEKIGDTFCDLNGERYRNEEFAFSALRNHHSFVDANRFTAPADCWGDVGAASGTLLTICAVASLRRGYARNRHAMVFASSEGGLRAAVVLAPAAKIA